MSGTTAQGKVPPPPTGFTKVTLVISPTMGITAGNASQAVAHCPSGSTPVGGGYEFPTVNLNAPPVVVSNYGLADGWLVLATNVLPGSVLATVRAYVYCVS